MISSPTRWALRVVVVIVLTLIAANFSGEWWYWEHRLPALGFAIDSGQRLLGRVALIRAAASLAAILPLLELLDCLPALSRRFWVTSGVTALLVVAALIAARFA